MPAKKTRDQSLEEMMDPASWVFDEKATKRQAAPRRPPRAVVSVAFSREDFERIEQYAQAQGRTLSEVIRNATMVYVRGTMVAGSPAQVTSTGEHVRSDFAMLPPTAARTSADADVRPEEVRRRRA